MQVRGPLMVEHEWIRKMLAVLKDALDEINAGGEVDPCFIDEVVDFFRTYADRTHHGKEEDILFRFLEGKKMSAPDRQAMDDLIADHDYARQVTMSLVETNRHYREGDYARLPEIAGALGSLVTFYPGHIAREDDHFFPETRAYMSNDEEQALLAEFGEFDRGMIHEKYRSLVKSLEEN